MNSKSKPLRIAFAILVGLNIINGGLGALDVVPVKVVGIVALGTAAFTAGIRYYVEGQIVPANAVAARVTEDGSLVAGPATNIPDGTKVQVGTDTGPSPYGNQ